MHALANIGQDGVVLKVDSQPLAYLAPQVPDPFIDAEFYLESFGAIGHVAEIYLGCHPKRSWP